MTRDDYTDPARLVRHARPPLRRSRRALHLLLSHLDITGRTLTACLIFPALWTAAMLTLALAVRF